MSTSTPAPAPPAPSASSTGSALNAVLARLPIALREEVEIRGFLVKRNAQELAVISTLLASCVAPENVMASMRTVDWWQRVLPNLDGSMWGRMRAVTQGRNQSVPEFIQEALGFYLDNYC